MTLLSKIKSLLRKYKDQPGGRFCFVEEQLIKGFDGDKYSQAIKILFAEM